MSYQGAFCWTEKEAMSHSNMRTKLDKQYFTSVKGKPCDTNTPEECWAITNRFDPTVREEDANTSA